MKNPTLICVHGYGLRGFFWETFAKIAREHSYATICPDLDMESPEQCVTQIRALVTQQATVDGRGVVVVGHSMGGILSALAAQDISAAHLEAVICIACPYGSRKTAHSYLLRFLMSRKLVPAYFVRRRFFGPKVKDTIRKKIFAMAVKEKNVFRELVNSETWFHNELIAPLGTVSALVISSEADRIVPTAQSAEFAKKIGCRHIAIPASRKIGHNDFGVSREPAEIVLNAIKEL